jgi:competence/damage-inducible protein CinA-like protein
MAHPHDSRRLLTAETLSIGTELTVGDTRDTNAGELAKAMTALGLRVTRMTALPDDLATVTEAFRIAIARSDVVVSTGGLGPTPDDLTREAIAAALGETVAVDPAIERWLRRLWSRRGMAFPGLNLKQAWLIPSADAMANPNGTAPGWFVTRPDGGVVIALPGPPREMRPMWQDHAVRRLADRGAGADVAAITYRLAGIGESQVADLLGEPLLRTTNPIVATYARAEAVDVRISAFGTEGATAAHLVDPAAAVVRERLGSYIWAIGDTTWAGAIGDRLAALGWTVAIVEIGTGGQVGALFGDVDWVRAGTVEAGAETAPSDADLAERARRARDAAGAEVGVAIHASRGTDDTAVTIAVVTPTAETVEHRTAFLGGANGRSRAALAAAAVLLASLDLPPGSAKP